MRSNFLRRRPPEVYLILLHCLPHLPLRTQDETGMYRTAEKGEIEYFPGVNSSFELPQKPDLILGTSKLDVGIRAGRVIDPLHNQGFFKNKPKDLQS